MKTLVIEILVEEADLTTVKEAITKFLDDEFGYEKDADFVI